MPLMIPEATTKTNKDIVIRVKAQYAPMRVNLSSLITVNTNKVTKTPAATTEVRDTKLATKTTSKFWRKVGRTISIFPTWGVLLFSNLLATTNLSLVHLIICLTNQTPFLFHSRGCFGLSYFPIENNFILHDVCRHASVLRLKNKKEVPAEIRPVLSPGSTN